MLAEQLPGQNSRRDEQARAEGNSEVASLPGLPEPTPALRTAKNAPVQHLGASGASGSEVGDLTPTRVNLGRSQNS